LHHRQGLISRVGLLESYSVLSYRTTETSLQDSTVKVTPHKWEDLPSLYPIVNGLASLQLGEVREVAQQVFLGASDCSGNKRVEW
jgi:hypothetical protein